MGGVLMATLWTHRLLMAVPIIAGTLSNRNALADIIAAESGETSANERLMFQRAPQLALAATPLVQVGWGLSFPVKANMRDNLQTLITSINSGQTAINRIHWYLLHNDTNENVLVSSSRNSAYVTNRIGQVFTVQDALTDLGLVVMSS
jgi:hypothetical protein